MSEKTIIEKLGITPIERQYNPLLDMLHFYEDDVRNIEKQRDEMLERDIDFLRGLEKLKFHYVSFMREREAIAIDKVIKMFDFSPNQKATGKSWSEIKELL